VVFLSLGHASARVFFFLYFFFPSMSATRTGRTSPERRTEHRSNTNGQPSHFGVGLRRWSTTVFFRGFNGVWPASTGTNSGHCACVYDDDDDEQQLSYSYSSIAVPLHCSVHRVGASTYFLPRHTPGKKAVHIDGKSPGKPRSLNSTTVPRTDGRTSKARARTPVFFWVATVPVIYFVASPARV
jgi:hypothetical protein